MLLEKGMDLKFYNIVAKGLTTSQNVLGADSNVCRSYRVKAGRGAFLVPLSGIGLMLQNTGNQ